MGTESGTISSGLAGSEVGEKLLREPFTFDFFQAVRLLERFLPEADVGGPVSRIRRPRSRASECTPRWRFRPVRFMPWNVPTRAPAKMTVNFMGLTGPAGSSSQSVTRR